MIFKSESSTVIMTPYGRSKAGDIATTIVADHPSRVYFTLPSESSTDWVFLSQKTDGVYRLRNKNTVKGQLNIGEGDNNSAIAYIQPGRVLDITIHGDLKISKGGKDTVSGWYEYLGPAPQTI